MSRLELRHVVLGDQRPLDLVISEGDVVAVSGWNTSEVLAVIAGLSRPAGGEVLVDGRPIVGLDEAVAAGVLLLPQGGGLATLLTAFENVVLACAERGSPEDPAALAREALAALGLTESADHLIEDLSGGQQQRVAVARALAVRPALLLADQATTDLDAGNRTLVIEHLRGLAASGAAVVLATDDPAVMAACDRSIVF